MKKYLLPLLLALVCACSKPDPLVGTWYLSKAAVLSPDGEQASMTDEKSWQLKEGGSMIINACILCKWERINNALKITRQESGTVSWYDIEQLTSTRLIVRTGPIGTNTRYLYYYFQKE